MRVAIVMTGLGVLPERTNNVSGHVQIPLKTCELLLQEGHSVIFIATKQDDGKALPANMPDVPIKFVSDGRKRGQLGRQNAKAGYNIISLITQIKQTVRAIQKSDSDVVHVFGFERMVRYGALIKIFSKKPVVVTLMGQKPSNKWRRLYKYVDHVSCLTESVADDWRFLKNKVSVNLPGVVRDLTSPDKPIPPSKKNKVIFWREASLFGGADLCMDAFKVLAPKYPNIGFEFAVRRNKDEVPGLDALADQNQNIQVHRFPYEDKFLLEKLISQSLCTILPYRELSIEPQMTVVETLSVGCPVICTNLRSLPELVVNGENGWVVENEDTQELIKTIDGFLSHRSNIEEMHENLAFNFNKKWNWGLYKTKLQDLYYSLTVE